MAELKLVDDRSLYKLTQDHLALQEILEDPDIDDATRAAALDAWSQTMGGRPWRGTANDIGFVPKTLLLPPAGATKARELTKLIAMRPASASGSVSGQRAAKWALSAMASAAIPCAFAFSMSAGRPTFTASGARPLSATTLTTPGA